MSSPALNLVALLVFAMTLSTLVGPLVHLSPAIPAIATFSVLGVATLDNLGFQGRGSTLLLDWLARFSPSYRSRVIRHEAGHFLVAHQSGIPVTGYALSAWEALRQGQAGRGGVEFDRQELEAALEKGSLSAQLLDRYCAVWMAGIAAETLLYGSAVGGGDDREQFQFSLTQLGFPPSQIDQKQRWALLRAKTILQEQQPAYEALVAALEQRAPVADCYAAIDQATR